MLRALARTLAGEDDTPDFVWSPRVLSPVGTLLNALPVALREQVYIWGGRAEAAKPTDLEQVCGDAMACWAASQFAPRQTSVVALGSANGAAVHLYATLGIPWLPQSFLVPVRRTVADVDDVAADAAWGRTVARPILERNPDLLVHQMYDPNQDRLMVRRMAYFRLKLGRLPPSYARFLEDHLAPAGTILLVDCQLRWPTTTLADRHFFQIGGEGGITPEEYVYGSPHVAEFLARQGSRVRHWNAPRPDADRAEAEWGFAAEIENDVVTLARRHGWRVLRLAFEHPRALSPVVADIRRAQAATGGDDPRTLLVESFVVQAPAWTLRSGAIPFWTTFPVAPDADWLERYLDAADRFDTIGVMLFSHGVRSQGIAPIERWRAIVERARQPGVFVGVDPAEFPYDFATFIRFRPALDALLDVRGRPLPPPLAWTDVEDDLHRQGPRWGVRLETVVDGRAPSADRLGPSPSPAA